MVLKKCNQKNTFMRFFLAKRKRVVSHPWSIRYSYASLLDKIAINTPEGIFNDNILITANVTEYFFYLFIIFKISSPYNSILDGPKP